MALQGYTVSYSFSGFQANSPQTPLPAQKLDIELYNIARAIGSIESYLASPLASGQAGGYSTLPIMKHEAIAALSANSTSGVNWFDAVAATIPAIESDPLNGKWNAPFWPVGGTMWAYVQTTLNAALAGGFSVFDLAALQAQALAYRSTP